MIFLKAFLVGGLICAVGQILIDWTKLTPARILVLFVTLGVLLGAIGLYEPLVKWAGMGASVPLTGFGYLLAKGTKEAVASRCGRHYCCDDQRAVGVLFCKAEG